MMQGSTIEWTDNTFNPWHGCMKVSPGCVNCYAETLDRRFGRAVWGPAKTTPRMEMSAKYWEQPLKWDETARKTGTRKRVFCASMADVFEDHPGVAWARTNLWGLIETTPNLDWQLLTKRPENISRMVPPVWLLKPRENVWYGTSVENQEYAEKRINELVKVPAFVRFLSCEPLLSAVDLSPWLFDAESGDPTPILDWVICGGESGAGARPMHPDWARGLRDVCYAAGVNFFFKQWGEYGTPQHATPGGKVSLFCGGGTARTVEIVKLGKHAAGRLLDGREWNEMPL